MLVPSLVKTPLHLLRLSPWNKNMDVSRADNCITIRWNLPISNPKPDLHNINAHSIDVYSVIIRKQNTGRWMDRQTDTWTSNVKPNTLSLSCGGNIKSTSSRDMQWACMQFGQNLSETLLMSTKNTHFCAAIRKLWIVSKWKTKNCHIYRPAPVSSD